MGNYVTEAEVREEGGTGTTARINARIDKWEAIVERLTGNYFRVLEPGELIFDGNNMDTLYFSVPLIEVTSVKINDETVALNADEFRAYTSRTPPRDARLNPRIELTPTEYVSPIFRTAPDTFLKGYEQKVTAKWGYVDDDGAGGFVAPRPIKDAIIQLVVLDLNSYFDQGASAYRDMKKEVTDGHSIEFHEAKGYWSMIPSEIADVICLYRRPQIITMPDPRVVWDPSLVIIGW